MLSSSKWFLSLRFPPPSPQSPVCCSLLPHTCCMSSPFYSSWFDHLNSIWWAVQITKLITMYSSPFPRCLDRRRPKYLPSRCLKMYLSIWDYTKQTLCSKYYLTIYYNLMMIMRYFLLKKILDPPSGIIRGSRRTSGWMPTNIKAGRNAMLTRRPSPTVDCRELPSCFWHTEQRTVLYADT